MTYCNLSYVFELEKMRDAFLEKKEEPQEYYYEEEYVDKFAQFRVNMERGRKNLAKKVERTKKKAFFEDLVISVSLAVGSLYLLL